jgi:hypothetical protein
LAKDLIQHEFLSEVTKLWNLVHKYACKRPDIDTTTAFYRGGPETTISITRSITLEGLSLDYVPNINACKELKTIAKRIIKHAKDTTEVYVAQIQFNRGWKLILLGLTQCESFARFVAMYAMETALPAIKETLLDNSTRYVSQPSPFTLQS